MNFDGCIDFCGILAEAYMVRYVSSPFPAAPLYPGWKLSALGRAFQGHCADAPVARRYKVAVGLR